MNRVDDLKNRLAHATLSSTDASRELVTAAMRHLGSECAQRWITAEYIGYASDAAGIPTYRLNSEAAPITCALDELYRRRALGESRAAEAVRDFELLLAKIVMTHTFPNLFLDSVREDVTRHLIYDRNDPRSLQVTHPQRPPSTIEDDARALDRLIRDMTVARPYLGMTRLYAQSRGNALAMNLAVEGVLFQVLRQCIGAPTQENQADMRRLLAWFPEMLEFPWTAQSPELLKSEVNP